MAPASIRPTRVEIDLSAARENAATVARIAGVDLYAVVKADAYGHGAVPVARALEGQPGVAGFAVSLVEEGSELRDAGITAPILVMGPALDGGYEELAHRDMTAMVSGPGDLDALAAIGRRLGRAVPVHIKVDTGMGRLGFLPGEVVATVRRILEGGGLVLTGIATHLACAETDDPEDHGCLTNRQIATMARALADAREAGARPEVVHGANSAAAFRFPAARYSRVRSGIAIYGNGVQPDPDAGSLRQVMRYVTAVTQIRDVPAGSSVSYGALWTAERPSRLAILPVGYADGITRRLSNKADVVIGGRRCPLVGAVSMDIAVADVTELGDAVFIGQEAVLLGSQGRVRIPAAELADKAGLLEYEVTCAVSKRVPRAYR